MANNKKIYTFNMVSTNCFFICYKLRISLEINRNITQSVKLTGRGLIKDSNTEGLCNKSRYFWGGGGNGAYRLQVELPEH